MTFEEQLQQMLALHNKKNADYGTDADPYANVRASEQFGVEPWVGAIIRLNDKITRIKSFIAKGVLENESLEDSLDDIAVYAVIAKILYNEAKQHSEEYPKYSWPSTLDGKDHK